MGFSALVKPFPVKARPSFINTCGQPLDFPFAASMNEHHRSAPDISASFPGQSLGDSPSWKHISTVIESKSEARKDPLARDGRARTKAIGALAKNARNLMLTHGLLAAFVIGIYGNTVRLMRFDRTCALVSVPFNIKKDGLRLLQKFFWNFTHPLVGKTVVGADPTVMKLSSADQDWVKSELRRARVLHWQAHVAEIAAGRRVEVYDEKTGRCVPYLLYQAINVNGRLFSRATMIWRAIEDTRIWKDGRLIPDPLRTNPAKPQIMKEYWRQLARIAEAKFYDRLNERIEPEDQYGLATMVCGGDIGEFALQQWNDARCRQKGIKPERESEPSKPAPPSSLSCPLSNIASGEGYVPDAGLPLLHPQHQTCSWRLAFGKDDWHRERSLVRMVIDDVGRPLTEFRSTYELVCALRDAIRGKSRVVLVDESSC